jgi:hypothetical protein
MTNQLHSEPQSDDGPTIPAGEPQPPLEVLAAEVRELTEILETAREIIWGSDD